MNLAEKYGASRRFAKAHRRKRRQPVALSDRRRDPIARAQRFIRAASLPKVERYFVG